MHSARIVMLNGSGVGVTIAANRNIRKIAIRHQLEQPLRADQRRRS